MYYTVDRIEGGYAVIEDPDAGVQNIKLSDLPDGIKEGDKLRLEDNIYIIDADYTRLRKKELSERFMKMFKN